ncbi:aldose epimerase family protein [Oleidesulfovibrio sp.]|uniref:aldose epimerase family protein n=1 Tax=Oleidesulfovibrio sp. TaxID=2909707 RepID=UPI003A8B7B9F
MNRQQQTIVTATRRQYEVPPLQGGSAATCIQNTSSTAQFPACRQPDDLTAASSGLNAIPYSTAGSPQCHEVDWPTQEQGSTTADVRLFMLRNTNGMTVRITNLGARLVSITLPHDETAIEPDSCYTAEHDISRRSCGTIDVIQGYDSPARYVDDPYYMGAVIGRLANRTKAARFTLNGKTYRLTANDGINHLHGGNTGLHNRLWQATPQVRNKAATLVLQCTSPDEEEGYPATLHLTATYTLTNDNTLRLELSAATDDTASVLTPVSLTAHPYFNLAGHDTATLDGHILTIHADRYLPPGGTPDKGTEGEKAQSAGVCEGTEQLTSAEGYSRIPAGKIYSVHGTPFDFNNPRDLTQALHEVPEGFDHYAIITLPEAASVRHSQSGTEDTCPQLCHAATLHHAPTGRTMQVHTNQTGLQCYTANFIAPDTPGKNGVHYQPQSAVCLEPHGYPNAVNNAHFPQIFVTEKQPHTHITEYRFFTHKAQQGTALCRKA